MTVWEVATFNKIFPLCRLEFDIFNCFFSGDFLLWGDIGSNMRLPISLSVVSGVEMGAAAHGIERVRGILVYLGVSKVAFLAAPFLTSMSGPLGCLDWLFVSWSYCCYFLHYFI